MEMINQRLRWNVLKKQIPQRNEFVTNKETASDEKVGPVFFGYLQKWEWFVALILPRDVDNCF